MNREELKSIRVEEEKAFHKKQQIWEAYATTRDQASLAYDEMQSARKKVRKLESEKQYAYDRLQRECREHHKKWEKLNDIRHEIRTRIKQLRNAVKEEQEKMSDCFNRAQHSFEIENDRHEAYILSQEGHEHKRLRDGYISEIAELKKKVEMEEKEFETEKKPDNSLFKKKKSELSEAKRICAEKEAEFERLRIARDSLKYDFDIANERHLALKNIVMNC